VSPRRQAQRKLSPWVICPTCEGDGRVDQLGVIVRDDFADEEWQDYLDGRYDEPCGLCEGSGKVRADAIQPIRRTGSAGQNVFYRDAADASEHLLRMMEGLA
jgi:hypothetical protein